MKPNWPEHKGNVGRPQKPQKKPIFTNGEERAAYIKEQSGNCWWIQKYLEGTLPQIAN